MVTMVIHLLLSLGLLQGTPALTECAPSATLSVRNAHAMAYDSDHGLVLLFGGADERQVLGDLWSWDGKTWRCLSDHGPPARTFPTLVFDEADDSLILFGGNRVLFGANDGADTFLDDMWSWDGAKWTRVRTPTPPARAEASVAYDSARKRIVLFGGYRVEHGERVRLGDTWEWDGRSWQLRGSDGPPPMNGTAMAYDRARRRIVLFGGSGKSGDTWEWNGEAWHRIDSAATAPRFNSAMTFDGSSQRILRFGGWADGERVGGTWEYDGERWKKVASTGPSPRNHTAMAYDSRRNVVVLIGGHDGTHVFGDTWEWDGSSWSERVRRESLQRVDNGH